MPADSFNVRDYGASGVAQPTRTLETTEPNWDWIPVRVGTRVTIYDAAEGATLDSVGIQRAIDAAHESGGGTVVVPGGDYLIAPIRLRSRVNLHLEPGARLWGSTNLDDYVLKDDAPPPSTDTAFGRSDGGLNGRQRLISASDAEDVAITGFGQISGQSPNWVIPWINSKPAKRIELRPNDTFMFTRCQRLRIEGIRILDTPSWTLVFDSCRYIQVRGIEIRGFDVINSDGIDLVNSSDATISDCRIHCTDDGICLKTVGPEGVVRNVTVTNCIVRTLCNALKLGTDSAGLFEDITFSNIVVHNPPDDEDQGEAAINLCSLDGGIVRNINFSNIVARNVKTAFYFVGGCRTRQQQAFRTPRPGVMERISISNLYADDVKHTSFICGHPDQPIRDVRLQNVSIRKTRGAYDHLPGPLRTPDRYPTVYMFGSRSGDEMPAYGMYQADAVNVTLRDVRIVTEQPDVRPCFVGVADSEVDRPDVVAGAY